MPTEHQAVAVHARPARPARTAAPAGEQRPGRARPRGCQAADAAAAEPPRTMAATAPTEAPAGDAEDVGAGQRVAGEGLEERAGRRRARAPTSSADQRSAGRAARRTMNSLGRARRARPGCAARPPTLIGKSPRPRLTAETSTRTASTSTGTTSWRQRGTRRQAADPDRRPAAGRRAMGATAVTARPAFRRRTSAMKNGAPTSGQHDAHLQLARAGRRPGRARRRAAGARRRAARSTGSASGGRGR